MIKQDIYEKELAKLEEIFKDVEEPKRCLVEGLIQDAAFLFAENHILKDAISQTGMVKTHPQHQISRSLLRQENNTSETSIVMPWLLRRLTEFFLKISLILMMN